MKILDTIREFLDTIETKDFYKYVSIGLGLILFLVLFTMYRFYNSVGYYQKQIRRVNEQREDIRNLLEKATLIKDEKEEVNTILEENPNFKINAYFEDLLAQLQLTNKKEISLPSSGRGDQEYDEKILTAKFTDMNMRELSELLQAIEKNDRVYTKELDIQKSRKNTRAIEVTLTIATLQPRTELTEVE